MLTVVPVTNNQISGHFTKADEFLLIDEQGATIKRLSNPILETEGCKGKAKRALLQQIVQCNPERVIVRGIGECMLRKLLSHDFRVFKSDSRELGDIHTVNNLIQMTQPDQGKKPPHRQSQNNCCNKQHQYNHQCGC